MPFDNGVCLYTGGFVRQRQGRVGRAPWAPAGGTLRQSGARLFPELQQLPCYTWASGLSGQLMVKVQRVKQLKGSLEKQNQKEKKSQRKNYNPSLWFGNPVTTSSLTLSPPTSHTLPSFILIILHPAWRRVHSELPGVSRHILPLGPGFRDDPKLEKYKNMLREWQKSRLCHRRHSAVSECGIKSLYVNNSHWSQLKAVQLSHCKQEMFKKSRGLRTPVSQVCLGPEC